VSTATAASKNGAKAAAPSPREIDLDGARAARAESASEPVSLVFGGDTFTLPVELPADFALYAAEGNLRACVVALLGEDADAFFAWKPSMDDLTALVTGASKVYGMSEGESPASPSS
jgi:hypothetical protein